MRDMNPVREMRAEGLFEVPAGGWTDDTVMTLATMDGLCDGYDRADMMARFAGWLHRDEYTWAGRLSALAGKCCA